MSTPSDHTAEQRHALVLGGCTPRPLAHYLKALGLLRIVAEQADPEATGCWQGDRFVLESRLSAEALAEFLLQRYAPTPVFSPWNKAAVFFGSDKAKSAREAMETLKQSNDPRFTGWRDTAAACEDLLSALAVHDSAQLTDKETKERVIQRCRARWPDEAVQWLDAALVLTGDGVRMATLLGTGGNDGVFDFSNNFLQRLVSALLVEDSSEELHVALFAHSARVLRNDAIGQFFPGAAGGPNNTAGFDGNAQANPWDFILLLEGALLFAAAASRQLPTSEHGSLSAPFTVRAVAAGYGGAADGDAASARAELWMPLWEVPTGLPQLKVLFTEGRISLGRGVARDGLDVARALTRNAFLRGISAFERYGIHERNGRSFFATPLGRLPVRIRSRPSRLADVEPWMDRFLSQVRGDNTPARVKRAGRALQEALFAAAAADETTDHGRKQAGLMLWDALVQAQSAMVDAWRWTSSGGPQGADSRRTRPPVPLLHRAWIEELGDGSAEFWLGTALASLRPPEALPRTQAAHDLAWRHVVEPVLLQGRPERALWSGGAGNDLVWRSGSFQQSLVAGMRRRLLLHDRHAMSCWEWVQSPGAPHGGRAFRGTPAPLWAVAAFVDRRTDDHVIERWFRRALLVGNIGDLSDHGPLAATWSRPTRSEQSRWPTYPPTSWALCKLVFAGHPVGNTLVPLQPDLLRLLERGRGGSDASRVAMRRLRASGVRVAFEHLALSPDVERRLAAALAFPIHEGTIARVLLPLIGLHEPNLALPTSMSGASA